MAVNKKKVKRIIGIIAKVFAVTLLISIAVGTVYFIKLIDTTKWKDFDPTKLENQAQTLVFFDKDNKPIGGMFSSQNRTNIKITDISPTIQKCFIAAEDVRFYSHPGVDIRRIIGAFITDLRMGHISQGGSTISQQLIKNTHLTNEQTITRKLQEARLALQLERVYTKDQILEMYINTVYFGNGAYGLQAAAQSYFGKNASELTIAQGALLAGVLKGPGIYAPHLHMDKSIARRDLVLDLMFKYNFITKEELATAKKEKVILAVKSKEKEQFGFFLDAASQEAESITKIAHEDMISGGYRIYTSMDSSLQSYCDGLISDKNNFPPPAKDGELVQSALVVLDSKTGAVRTVVGGREYTTKMGFNRATSSLRQPGSAIKPVLVYGPAIDRYGYTGATMIQDEPVNYNGYAPADLGKYLGWVTLRQALVRSLNVPAVRVLHDVGLSSCKDFASRLGIRFDKGDNNLSLALGGFTTGVTPLDFAGAYTAFPNGGRVSIPSFISRIEDSEGKVIYQSKYETTPVMTVDTAFIMTDILHNAAASGTASSLNMPKIPVAAKTGTVAWDKGNRDVWLASYNPEYTMVTWMGFDRTDNTHYLSSKVTGGSYPAVVQKAIYTYLYKNREAPKFVVPDTVTVVALDKKALLETQQVLLASPLTPEDQKLYEYFPKSQAPTNQSTYWQVPISPTGFSLSLSINNYPNISFLVAQDFARYDLYRIDGFGQTVKIKEFKAANGTIINYVDNTAGLGIWQYYILPVQPDLNVTGSPTQTLSITVTDPLATTPQDTGLLPEITLPNLFPTASPLAEPTATP